MDFSYLAHFLAGIFLVNGIPHFINGVSGHPFPSPFARPPGRGDSSPLVNTLWGLMNFLAGLLLLLGVGSFHLALNWDSFFTGLGMASFSFVLAVYFGRLRRS